MSTGSRWKNYSSESNIYHLPILIKVFRWLQLLVLELSSYYHLWLNRNKILTSVISNDDGFSIEFQHNFREMSLKRRVVTGNFHSATTHSGTSFWFTISHSQSILANKSHIRSKLRNNLLLKFLNFDFLEQFSRLKRTHFVSESSTRELWVVITDWFWYDKKFQSSTAEVNIETTIRGQNTSRLTIKRQAYKIDTLNTGQCARFDIKSQKTLAL